jgi:asparagine synthase (glutamine-hydrolysing)
MCRIAGLINNTYQPSQLKMLIEEMCLLQKHGGPDDEGFYLNAAQGMVLGHRRLSIIDTSSAGHQPMKYADDRYVISYNGEVYNYKVLRNELKRLGYVFTTQTDTEVILAAYTAWGTAAFARFNGMFAFAIWDNAAGELLLARGGAGIKPLYYAHTEHGFAFASEVRAFKAVPYLQEENSNWPVYLMAYGHLPEPVTTLKNVKPLPKGNYLKYNVASGQLSIKTFTRYNYLEKISDRQEAIALIKTYLEDAVKRHLISDAPIGVFLSGGLDSSIIAMLANKHQEQLNTISIYFEDNLYSEKKYQDVIQQRLSCSNRQFLLKEENFNDSLPAIIKAMDLPCCDGINTWFISKYAKESGLKAVLSGIGGDELLGGYPSFQRIKTALLLEKLPNKILRGGHFSDSKRIRRMAYLSIKNPVGRYLFLRGQFVPGDIARFLNIGEEQVWNILSEQPHLPDIDYLSPSNQASWLETNMYMQNQLLRDADVMSMAHGVEIRVPFLDKEFLQLALKIQSRIKYSGTFGKQLLIDSFKDVLPEMIWNRPKMGFSFPFKEWLSSEMYGNANGKDLSIQHTALKNNQMHWSQFFTLLLMQTYNYA